MAIVTLCNRHGISTNVQPTISDVVLAPNFERYELEWQEDSQNGDIAIYSALAGFDNYIYICWGSALCGWSYEGLFTHDDLDHILANVG